MTQINPFTGALVMGTTVQQRQGVEKERQLRRLQNLSKNTALQGEDLDHQVENTDTVHPSNDGQGGQGSNPQQHPDQQKPDDEQPHIDLKA